MPHAHVPPSLLRTWNNFAVQKKRDAETREVAAEQHLPQTQETYEFMDSDQESRLSWSLSPERTNSPSGLPPSSPVKNVSARYNRELKSGEKPTVGEPLTGIFEGNAAAAVNHESQQNHSEAMSQNIARQPTPEKKQVGRPVINNETSIEAWPSLPVDTSRREADEQQSSPGQGSQSRHLEATHKSSTPSSPPVSIIDPPNIESDNESMMESSVPLALGEVLPDPTQSSQTGKDFRSSGTSLSGSKERVQVSETPALSKGLIKGAEPTSSNSYPSPHAHKISSSQSRILNTLPSHASYEGAQSSNEAPNFTQSEGSEAIRVDSSWTQPQASMNSTSQSQDASTNSQSDVVLDSSGPAQPHQIFSASHTGSHGHPPPSVDELGSHDHSQSQPMDTTQTSPLPNEEVKALVGETLAPIRCKKPISSKRSREQLYLSKTYLPSPLNHQAILGGCSSANLSLT
ncbi:hypothetical protein N7470_001012 [Penicillium chermesinum]|nr:hypothetical protein N7470_001012 [Penicillium chermesinum]